MIFGIESGLISLIQSILLIISALLIIFAVVGVLKIDGKLDNVVYARIHILGIVDVACIIAFIALGQPLFALIYLFLAPLLAHALANAYFHGEDTLNNPVLNPNIEDDGIEEVPDLDDGISEDLDSVDEDFKDDLDLSDDIAIDEDFKDDLDLSDDIAIDEDFKDDLDLSDDIGIYENLDEKSGDDGND
ncbi:hypothetical protein [Methanobrevibacter olleyae]|uniref:Energy-converting hydrogenase B subunit C EhbC n=1 Tax=Methanobrevibacter olleyae TaxID=294671 RepID=A0A126R206_METOL|nr:hypothetical protein [Methanobrevibacter olleyae]AMK16009.1 energy-converting hydrogenase B subunit C EhbC [Methanobrevibacter olleyae]